MYISYDKAMHRLAAMLCQKKDELRLTCNPCKGKNSSEYCKPCTNRRGDFRALSFGVSYGGGQTVSTRAS